MSTAQSNRLRAVFYCLVTGCDLLAPYEHLGLGGVLWVQTTADPDAVPTFDNLGDGAKMNLTLRPWPPDLM
ncbi:phage baseplate plug family protein [Metapseudomonas otitidis]|uniref:phage baseplate plug family protein n=1 Tax=Metapseudomonas otitidis TaxID=319939 RepID=UPI0013F5B03F|nr:hypothetical protein [Pseudomonas otitidis]